MRRGPTRSTLFPYTTLFRCETLDADGNRTSYGETMGFRSMQHLEPLVEGRFAQTEAKPAPVGDRKSTRLNSSHANISYAVLCLIKKKSPFLVTLLPATTSSH